MSISEDNELFKKKIGEAGFQLIVIVKAIIKIVDIIIGIFDAAMKMVDSRIK